MESIDFRTLPDSALVRQRHLLPLLPFTAPTLWRQVKAGKFPTPIRMTGRMTAWKWGDVRAWLESQTTTAPHAGGTPSTR